MPRDVGASIGEHEIPLGTLLFAGFGSAASWGIHFNLVYLVNTLSCTTDGSGGAAVIYLTTAAFAALSLAAGWVAWRKWRMLGNAMRVADAVREPTGRTSILLFVGMAGGVLFTLFIITEGLVPVFVRGCSLAG